VSCEQTGVTLDAARAASATLTAEEGGRVVATAANGVSYTLEVPPGALLRDETITLTPVTTLGGFGVGGGIVAAVHAEPSGLDFLKPATLTIGLATAPGGPLAGIAYEGPGAEFHRDVLTVTGTTARIPVLHFSGFAAGSLSSPEVRAILARPLTGASQQFADDFLALANQGVQDRQPYLNLVRRWYTTVIRPALQGGVGSDPRLRQALRDWNQWLLTVEIVPPLFGLPFSLPPPAENAEALDLIAAAIRDAIARANARCLAQHSLAEAETALEWQVIAGEAGVGTPGRSLDLDKVLDGLCVEAHYDDVSYPNDPPLGVASELLLHVGLNFIDGTPASGDRMSVDITPNGTVELFAGPFDTNPDRSFAIDFTPQGNRELRIDVHSCGHVPGRRRLARVCQDAFIIRGLSVEPQQAALSPGGFQQFVAKLLGQTAPNVTWTATGGMIDQTGGYAAGQTAGSFEVRATNPVDNRFGTASVVIGTTTTSTTLPGNLAGTWIGTFTRTANGSMSSGCGGMQVVAQPGGGFRLFFCQDNWCGSPTSFGNCAAVFDVTGSSASFSGLMVDHTDGCCKGCPGQGRGWELGCQISGSIASGHLTASFNTDISFCSPGFGTTALDLQPPQMPHCGDCVVTPPEKCEPPGTSTCGADCRFPPSPD
jgi:hypothetical protein